VRQGVNWTEILARAGVPEAPGYQELLAQIRAEKEAAVQGDGDTVQPSRKRKRKKAPKR
jgi:hypothetical protein